MPSADSSRSAVALLRRPRRLYGTSKPSPQDREASPDKSINFYHANASFTLRLEPSTGFASLGTLAQGAEPSMTFLSIISWLCLRLPSHEASPLRSCHWLVLFHNLLSLLNLTYRFHVQWTLTTSVDARAGRTNALYETRTSRFRKLTVL